MSEEKFTTCVHLDGEDYDDVIVELYCAPSEPEVGIFHPTTEVESITHNGVDITHLATKENMADLCDEFNHKMNEQFAADRADYGDYLYEQRRYQ